MAYVQGGEKNNFILSSDIVWKTFNTVNLLTFTCVVVCTVLFHKKV